MPAPDVAIVGGGIAGTSLAAELAARGLRVVLYERTAVAAGASGRNSGAIWHPHDPVLAALYRETLARYRALPNLLAEHAPDHAFRLGAGPVGLLVLGWDEGTLRATAAADAASNPEMAPAFVGVDALRALEPGLADGLAAVRYEICFPVTPSGATRAMAALAGALGAEMREGAEVLEIAREAGRASGVLTAEGVEPAGAVVVAAGAGTPSLIDPTGAWTPIVPAWGVVVELVLGAPAPAHVLEEAAPDGSGGDHEHPESGFSLVTAVGRSALGSTYLPDEPDPRAWAARLRDRGARFVPAVREAPATGYRACARPVTADGRPLDGPVPGVERLFIVAGHGPWGMSTAAASAAHVAALVAGEPDPRPAAVRDATDPARFGAPPA